MEFNTTFSLCNAIISLSNKLPDFVTPGINLVAGGSAISMGFPRKPRT